MELIRGIRNVRAEYKVEPSRKLGASVDTGEHASFVDEHGDLFARLCNVHPMQALEPVAPAPERVATIAAGDITVYLRLADLVDLETELQRLQRELDDLEQQIARTEALLQNDNFVSRAKPEVVQRERDKLGNLTASRQTVKERIASLG